MVSQGASKVNVSFIVDDSQAEEVIKSLHLDFFEELEKL
jgi:aspartate kinase